MVAGPGPGDRAPSTADGGSSRSCSAAGTAPGRVPHRLPEDRTAVARGRGWPDDAAVVGLSVLPSFSWSLVSPVSPSGGFIAPYCIQCHLSCTRILVSMTLLGGESNPDPP